jgi:hypothetical protein
MFGSICRVLATALAFSLSAAGAKPTPAASAASAIASPGASPQESQLAEHEHHTNKARAVAALTGIEPACPHESIGLFNPPECS